MLKRILSLFLSLVLLITMLPVPAMAEELPAEEAVAPTEAAALAPDAVPTETAAPAETIAPETEAATSPVETTEAFAEESEAPAEAPTYASVSTVDAPAALAGSTSCGSNLTWDLSSKGILTISGTGAMTDYADPSLVPWYSSRYTIEAVVLPAGLTTIGANAFAYCTNLGGINIPDGVVSIGSGAFLNCTDMSFVTIPDSVTSIGDGAFRYCASLASVVLPQNLTYIGESAFGGCAALTSISVPAPASVGGYAFADCLSLETAVFADGVNSIGMGVFSGCTALTSVTLPDTITAIAQLSFLNCYALTEITIPEGVTAIGGSAFNSCTSMVTAVLPESLKTIGDHAFYNCAGLTNITIPAGVTAIGTAAFQRCGNLTSVTVPAGVTELGAQAFDGCSALQELTIESGVTAIGSNAFRGCSKLTFLSIPDTVTTLGSGAFEGCSGLTTAVLSDTLTAIPDGAFTGCAALTEMIIPESVTAIGNGAFAGCSGLAKITVPGSVGSISEGAFAGCSGLAEVVLTEGVGAIGDSAFASCSALKEITIPGSVSSIGEGAFSGCSGLSSVVMNDGVTAIGDSAFRNCTDLTSVVIPDSVTSIGGGAFAGCSDLAAITIPDSVTSLGSDVFVGCASGFTITYEGTMAQWFALCNGNAYPAICSDGTIANYGTLGDDLSWQLTEDGTLILTGEGEVTSFLDDSTKALVTSVVFQDGITSIADHAFEGFPNLTTVEIPDSVTSIGKSAFSGCSSLTDMNVPGTVTKIGEDAFADCNADLIIRFDGTSAQWNSLYSGTGFQVTCIDGGSGSCGDNLSWSLSPEGVLTITGEGSLEDFLSSGQKAHVKSVVIGDGTTSIGNNVFSGCANLTDINIPESVTSIADNAFSGCDDLTITYPGTIDQFVSIYGGESIPVTCPDDTYIEYGPAGENAVWALDEDGNLTIIGSGVVEDFLPEDVRDDVKSVEVGSGITGIGKDAFSGCSNLTDISIPETVTTIGDNAFGSCTGLTSITIPESVTSIADNAFSGCNDLTITYPGTIDQFVSIYGGESIPVICPEDTYIEYGPAGDNAAWALDEDGNLIVTGSGTVEDFLPADLRDDVKSVQIDSGITGIGDSVFKDCTNLTNVSISDTVDSLGDNTFDGCTSLEVIEFAGSAPEINGTPIPDVEVIVCYPAENDTWTDEILDKLGDNIIPVAVAQTGEVTSLTAEKTLLLPGEQTVLTAELIYATAETAVIWTLAEGDDAYAELTANGSTAILTAKAVSENQTVTVIAVTEGGKTTVSLDLVIQPVAAAISLMNGNQDVTGATVYLDVNSAQPSLTFYALISPEDAQDAVNWAYDTSKASFTENADGSLTLTALPDTGSGSTVITATTLDGSNKTAQVTVNFVSLITDKEEIPGEDPADFNLFAGKNKTLKVYDAETGKALTAKQITWSIPKEYDAFATINSSGKLTARKVLQKVRIEVYGTMVGSQTPTVSYLVDIFPLATYMEVLHGDALVNGKTLPMDYTAESITLTAGVHPLDGLQDVTWTVSDEKKEDYAHYEKDGNNLIISAPTGKAGTVTVKVATKDGSNKSATVKIQFALYTSSVEIDKSITELTVGDKAVQLNAVATPAGVTKTGIVWSLKDAADKAYVNLSSSGKISPKAVLAPQTVTIVATSKDGMASDEHAITVYPKSESQLVLKSGDAYVTKTTQLLDVNQQESITLAAYSYGAAEMEAVEWSPLTNKSAVITVNDDGTLTVQMIAAASITVNAKAADGRKASVTIKGVKQAQSIQISQKKTNITKGLQVASGKSLDLQVTLMGAASNKVTWSIAAGGEAYASLSTSGKLTANKDLTSQKQITVIAATTDGSDLQDTIDVTLYPLAQGVQIYALENGIQTFSVRTNNNWWARSSTTMDWDVTTKGDIIFLDSLVYPYSVNDPLRGAMQDVTWKSSAPKVADFVKDENGALALDADGNVQLKISGTGSLTITATAMDGSNQKVSFKLNVVKHVSDFHLAPQVLASGKSLNLAKLLEIYPAGTTTKKLSWAITGGAEYATISSSGSLKAKTVTEHVQVEVTVTAQDALAYSETFTIDLYPATTKVLLSSGSEDVTGKTLTLAAGESVQLTADCQPDNAANLYTWTSSKAAAVAVDEEGNVTVIGGSGTVTITCTAADGSGKKATVKIKIG